jgi:hypothetical protein
MCNCDCNCDSDYYGQKGNDGLTRGDVREIIREVIVEFFPSRAEEIENEKENKRKVADEQAARAWAKYLKQEERQMYGDPPQPPGEPVVSEVRIIKNNQ